MTYPHSVRHGRVTIFGAVAIFFNWFLSKNCHKRHLFPRLTRKRILENEFSLPTVSSNSTSALISAGTLATLPDGPIDAFYSVCTARGLISETVYDVVLPYR